MFELTYKQYKMTNHDIDILLQIVYSLCVCSRYFDDRELNCQVDYTHEMLETNTCCDELLSLHYRRLYGGMRGDMQLLKMQFLIILKIRATLLDIHS